MCYYWTRKLSFILRKEVHINRSHVLNLLVLVYKQKGKVRQAVFLVCKSEIRISMGNSAIANPQISELCKSENIYSKSPYFMKNPQISNPQIS
jgi:hypothetical protein